MMTLKGEQIFLRALEPSDINFLYILENTEALWEVSNTSTPYSKYILEQYLENSHRDIYEVKQLRLVICTIENEEVVGLIDLFDFNPKHLKVGVGIVIFAKEHKQRGFASEALKLTSNYAFQHLNVHQVYAGITEDNKLSIKLFETAGFEKTGVKRDWIFSKTLTADQQRKFKDEFFYQLILKS